MKNINCSNCFKKLGKIDEDEGLVYYEKDIIKKQTKEVNGIAIISCQCPNCKKEHTEVIKKIKKEKSKLKRTTRNRENQTIVDINNAKVLKEYKLILINISGGLADKITGIYKNDKEEVDFFSIELSEAIEIIRLNNDNTAKVIFAKEHYAIDEWKISRIYIPEDIMFNKI